MNLFTPVPKLLISPGALVQQVQVLGGALSQMHTFTQIGSEKVPVSLLSPS